MVRGCEIVIPSVALTQKARLASCWLNKIFIPFLPSLHKGFSFRDRLESAVCEETTDLHKTLICVTVNDLLIFPPPSSGRPCVAEIQNRLTIMDIVRVAISMQPKCGPSLPLLPILDFVFHWQQSSMKFATSPRYRLWIPQSNFLERNQQFRVIWGSIQ